MFPLFTWWAKLGVEAARPLGQWDLPDPHEAEPPEERVFRTGCPVGHDPLDHEGTDAVCHVHDRLLLFRDMSQRQQLRWVELAHLPLYLAYAIAYWQGPRWPMAAFVVLAAAGFVRIHVRRYKLARRWSTACVLFAGLAVGWSVLPRPGPSWRGAAWFAGVVAFALLLQHVRRTIGVRALLEEQPGSPTRHLWVADGGAPARAGVRAAACAFVGSTTLVAGMATAVLGRGVAARRFLGAAVLALLLLLLIIVMAATQAGDEDELEPVLPAWATEPPDWHDLDPWSRSVRRFFLRLRQSFVMLVPAYRSPPGATAPVYTLVERVVFGLGDVLVRTADAAGRGLRRAVLPLFGAAGLCFLAGQAGLRLGDAVAGQGGGRTPIVALAFLSSVAVAAATIVWGVVGQSAPAVAGSVMRTVLVLAPNTLVRLLACAVVVLAIDSVRRGALVTPVPLLWLVLVLVVAQVAVPRVLDWL